MSSFPLLPTGSPISGLRGQSLGSGTTTASRDASRCLDFNGPAPGVISPSGRGPADEHEASSMLLSHLVEPTA
jgi:hypothetical protein